MNKKIPEYKPKKVILWGCGGASCNLSFPKNISCIIDDQWNNYSVIKKIYYELYWKLVLRRIFKRICFPMDRLGEYDPNTDLVILGDIFRREEITLLAKKYGFIAEINLFEAFDLSPQFCDLRHRFVTTDEIRIKNYENDDLKLEIMCSMIPQKVKSICDVGCGKRKLIDFFKYPIKYHGIDYIQKANDIINCDLNTEEFPRISADCFFCCGIIEFIDDWKKLLLNIIDRNPEYILLSYAAREYSSYSTVRSRVYHNSIYSWEFASLICSHGYVLESFKRYESRQVLYRFKRITDVEM